MNLDLRKLPSDLLRNILSYVKYPETPSCQALKEEHTMYYLDHNWVYTKQTGYYHIHYFMSFSEYYFDKRDAPYGYLSHEDYLYLGA